MTRFIDGEAMAMPGQAPGLRTGEAGVPPRRERAALGSAARAASSAKTRRSRGDNARGPELRACGERVDAAMPLLQLTQSTKPAPLTQLTHLTQPTPRAGEAQRERDGAERAEHAERAERGGQRQLMVPTRPKSTTRRCVSQMPVPQHTGAPSADGRGPVRWARDPRADAWAGCGMRSACRMRGSFVQRRFGIKIDHDP